MSETETKAERKERKRLRKLAKEAKRAAKKRKLEESGDVEEPETKKRKLNEEETTEQDPNGVAAPDETQFVEITKAIVKATKDQLQNALLQCAKQSPSSIPEMEKNLESTEIDADLTALLTEQRETAAAADPAADPAAYPAAAAATGDEPAPSPGKITGTVQKWRHEKGFGFITRDDGKGDVFCHCNDVWAIGGARNVQAGSRVEFEIEQGERGDAAKNVCAIGGAECPGGRQAKGTVSKWLDDREFGFVTLDDGSGDLIFFSRDVWDAQGYFAQGDRIEFDIKVKDDGRRSATYCTFEGKEVDRSLAEQ